MCYANALTDFCLPAVDMREMQCDVQKLNRPEGLERIASDEGFKILNNQGLGNCMFYALADQLQVVKGIQISPEELRVNLVKFLQETLTW